MKLTERYLSVIDALGGRATIKQIQDAMIEMRWVGFSHSSIYIVFKRLRAKGKMRLMKDGYYVTEQWIKNQEDII